MSTLTPAERTAAHAIAMLLVGYRLEAVERALCAARNRMLGQCLIAGWDLDDAAEHACAFSKRIADELADASPSAMQTGRLQ